MTAGGVVQDINNGVKEVLEGGCCGGVENATELSGKDCLSYIMCYSLYIIAFLLCTSVRYCTVM